MSSPGNTNGTKLRLNIPLFYMFGFSLQNPLLPLAPEEYKLNSNNFHSSHKFAPPTAFQWTKNLSAPDRLKRKIKIYLFSFSLPTDFVAY